MDTHVNAEIAPKLLYPHHVFKPYLKYLTSILWAADY